MKNLKNIIKYLPKTICVCSAVACLLIFPKSTSDGVKEGLTLLGSVVIPSLFPFLVLSSYICESSLLNVFAKIFKKPAKAIFNTSSYSTLPIFMGLIGGYPTGAKTVYSLYKSGKIPQKEAEHLMYWCVNPGPAFCINSVGVLMLNNIKSGIVLYISMILSTFTMGILMRIFKTDEVTFYKYEKNEINAQYPLIVSVTDGCSAILNISSWILLFSCFFGIFNEIKTDGYSEIFIKSVLEVTTGSKACIGHTSLPVISAVLGFGGICVFCQILPYLRFLKVNIKNFVCGRIINASLCGFFTSVLLNIFPEAKTTQTVINSAVGTFTFSYTVPVFCILLIMCGIFIFQLDNRKKVC